MNQSAIPECRPRPTSEIDTFTRCYVRKRAKALIGKFGFRHADREDIEQQLYLKLAPRLHQADPDDPRWKAFVAKTVTRHIISLIRHNEAEMRDHRRICSIDVLVASGEEEPVEMSGTIEENETPRRRGRRRRSDQELAELQLDLHTCVDDLDDPRHRELCERLKRDSIAQVARDMGVPRTTLNAWLVNIREQFRQRGLGIEPRGHRHLAGQAGS